MSELAIQVRGLEKTLGSFHLGPIDLDVPTGAIYGFVGSNGAGKTTTMDLIMGMGNKEAGEIRVFGMDHIDQEVAVKQRVGFVSPDLSFTAWGTVARAIAFIRNFYETWDDDYCIDLLKRFTLGSAKRVGALSFGEKTKLNLVIALAHRPELLILDEPLTGLDAIAKQEVFAELLDAVQDESRTVMISSHNLDDIERYTDHLGILDEGELLLQGPTAQLVERYQTVHCALSNGADPNIIEGIRVLEQTQDRWRLLIDKTTNAIPRLEAQGATEIAAAPVTLEELFVALIKGQREE